MESLEIGGKGSNQMLGEIRGYTVRNPEIKVILDQHPRFLFNTDLKKDHERNIT
jgi:hypothetical protein